MNKFDFKTIFGQTFFIAISLIILSNLATAQNTLSADDYYRRGVEKLTANNCREAIKDLDKAIRLNPRKAEYFKTRSDCLRLLPVDLNYEKSLADLNKALKLKPDYLEAYRRRIEIYSAYLEMAEAEEDKAKYYSLAKADFDKIIELEPGLSALYISRALFLMDYGNSFKAALKDLAKAIELCPACESGYTRLIQFYLSYGDYDKAIDEATKLTKNSTSGSGFFERGEIYVEIGKYEEAIADFTEALKREMRWGHIHTLEGRAAAYRAVGKIALAEADEREVEKLLPGRTATRLQLSGKPPKPLTDAELMNSYLEMSKRAVEPDALTDEGMYKLQIKRLNAILEVEPQSSAAFLQRGSIHSRHKEYEKAIADYSEAIKLDPHNFRAFNDRGTVCARVGNYERAIADFTRAMSINPQQSASLYNFALVLLNKGLPDQSVKMFSFFLTKEPKNVNAYRLRAKAFRQLGKTALAEADEKMIKMPK